MALFILLHSFLGVEHLLATMLVDTMENVLDIFFTMAAYCYCTLATLCEMLNLLSTCKTSTSVIYSRWLGYYLGKNHSAVHMLEHIHNS